MLIRRLHRGWLKAAQNSSFNVASRKQKSKTSRPALYPQGHDGSGPLGAANRNDHVLLARDNITPQGMMRMQPPLLAHVDHECCIGGRLNGAPSGEAPELTERRSFRRTGGWPNRGNSKR